MPRSFDELSKEWNAEDRLEYIRVACSYAMRARNGANFCEMDDAIDCARAVSFQDVGGLRCNESELRRIWDNYYEEIE